MTYILVLFCFLEKNSLPFKNALQISMLLYIYGMISVHCLLVATIARLQVLSLLWRKLVLGSREMRRLQSRTQRSKYSYTSIKWSQTTVINWNQGKQSFIKQSFICGLVIVHKDTSKGGFIFMGHFHVGIPYPKALRKCVSFLVHCSCCNPLKSSSWPI